MTDSILPLRDGGLLRTTEDAQGVHFDVLTVTKTFTLPAEVAQHLVDDILAFRCMQGPLPASQTWSVPQGAKAYRYWYYWAEGGEQLYRPMVYNPDLNEHTGPVQLPIVATEAQAEVNARAYIDTQWRPLNAETDDNPAAAWDMIKEPMRTEESTT